MGKEGYRGSTGSLVQEREGLTAWKRCVNNFWVVFSCLGDKKAFLELVFGILAVANIQFEIGLLGHGKYWAKGPRLNLS